METGTYTPIGWRATTPSYIEGHNLEYFTPYPFSELLGKVKCCSQVRFEPLNDGLDSYLFAALIDDTISRRRNQAASANLIRPDSQTKSIDDNRMKHRIDVPSLIDFAEQVLGQHQAMLRDQAVYTKGRSLVYAREDLLQELLQDYADTLNSGPQNKDKAAFLILAQMTMLLIHPFLDGNGRYTRALLLSLGAQHHCLGTAAMLTGIQWWNREWFNDTITAARNRGLNFYIDAMVTRLKRAEDQIASRNISLTISNFLAALQMAAGSQKSARRLVDSIVATGEIESTSIAATLCCSDRKANGVRESLLLSMSETVQLIDGAPVRSLADSIETAFLEQQN